MARGPRRWNDRWEWIADLGGGGQAHTFLVRDLTDGSTGWVLKRLNNPNRVGRFQREVDAQSRLKSPHIPPVKDFFVSDEMKAKVLAHAMKLAGTKKIEVWDGRTLVYARPERKN